MMKRIQIREALAILVAILVGFVSRWPWSPLFGATAAIAVRWHKLCHPNATIDPRATSTHR
jgi:hypothetical protein